MNARLARSGEAMAVGYPHLAFKTRDTPNGEVGIWRGVVQPVRSLEGLNDILDDLAHQRLVRVVAGEVRHSRDCREHGRHDWMNRLVYWRTRFETEVHYDGSRADPRCWVRSPPVSTLHKKKHVWSDGSICPFLSSDGWDYDRDDVVDFMGHVAIWLVKWTLWDQTGFWIGPEHDGSPENHLVSIKPAHRCWCRSGRIYNSCHLEHDRRLANSRRAQLLRTIENTANYKARSPSNREAPI